MITLLGSEMCAYLQNQAKQRFANRYTGEHTPSWVKGSATPVQFEDDADWLKHTRFWITKKGEIAHRPSYCESSPTWPFNPELRKE